MIFLGQFFWFPQLAMAQKNAGSSKSKTSKISTTSDKLSKAIRSGDQSKIADVYFELAEEYEGLQDYPRSEEYYKKAKEYYTNLKDVDGTAVVSRKLAKVQEILNKKEAARGNYQQASQHEDAIISQLNTMDLNRLEAQSDDEVVKVVNSKIDKLNTLPSRNTDLKSETEKALPVIETQIELAEGYDQLGDVLLLQNKIEPAILNYQNAISKAGDNSTKILALNDKITSTYIENKEFDKAIDQNINLLKSEVITNSAENKVKITEKLSSIYLRKNDEANAQKMLLESYKLASESGQTIKARDLITNIGKMYDKKGMKDEEIELYKSYLIELDSIISKDSTIMDKQLLEATEVRIQRLEDEKELKDKLISKQTQFSNFLLGGLAILGIALFLIYKSLSTVKLKNKKIALQALRKEMNPHFIFNSLNSVNQFIASNDERTANQYLTQFSTLMRSVMENSNSDFIPLEKELDLLTNYLKLEHQRFNDKFDYIIKVDPALNVDHMIVPNMLIQPHVENAIWHGLRYKKLKGSLVVSFSKDPRGIRVTIDDNGIGILESKKLKTQNQQNQISLGTTNIKERIALLNSLYKCTIEYEVAEKQEGKGTIVTLHFPADYEIKT